MCPRSDILRISYCQVCVGILSGLGICQVYAGILSGLGAFGLGAFCQICVDIDLLSAIGYLQISIGYISKGRMSH